jgi:hypothetical protein
MRLSRLSLLLVVSLALALPASAAPFCSGLPKWAEAPCFLGFEWVSGWWEPELAGGVNPIWLPAGGAVDPNGGPSPVPPPAPATAPTDPELDTH